MYERKLGRQKTSDGNNKSNLMSKYWRHCEDLYGTCENEETEKRKKVKKKTGVEITPGKSLKRDDIGWSDLGKLLQWVLSSNKDDL